MTTKTKNRKELFLDPDHPNYAELKLAGLTPRDTCEFYLTSDGKAIAFNFCNLDEYMTYLGKLQGSRVECKVELNNAIGWSYTDSYCLDNRPDGDGWFKFDVMTYASILQSEIMHNTPIGKDDLLYATADLVTFAYDCRKEDVFFRFGKLGLEMESTDRNVMSIDNRLYMGIVFNLTDVKS